MEKIKLFNLKVDEVLSRDQLKKVFGGFGSGESGSGGNCKTAACAVYDSGTGHTTPGNCSVHIENWGSITQKVDFTCFCKTANHQTPGNLGSNGGVSYCVG